jgi:hypothetical protein
MPHSGELIEKEIHESGNRVFDQSSRMGIRGRHERYDAGVGGLPCVAELLAGFHQ